MIKDHREFAENHRNKGKLLQSERKPGAEAGEPCERLSDCSVLIPEEFSN